MTTFLWMLYLAFTELLTLNTIVHIVLNISDYINCYDSKTEKKHNNGAVNVMIKSSITCLLWSIWYFYYLN